MRKVILSSRIIDAGYKGAKNWLHKSLKLNDSESDKREEIRWALEAAIPIYLDTDEPGRWQYGINMREVVGGPFNRFQWFDSREAAQAELAIITGERGQYKDVGDGHGVAARPCRRWIGRPFWEETFDDLVEWDDVPQASFTLHDATSEQAEKIFDDVCDHIYEVADKMKAGITVTGSLLMGGFKGRTVKDPSEVPFPGPGE